MLLSAAGLAFVTERHLATCASLRPDGTPHVTPVGFTWDDNLGVARIITSGTSVKARNADHGSPVVLCQLDGRRWLSLEGTPVVRRDAAEVRLAEQRYALRYRVPRENPLRVVIEVAVRRVYGTAEFLAAEAAR
jgi:PPOX class probable F420-dependent enzyme